MSLNYGLQCMVLINQGPTYAVCLLINSLNNDEVIFFELY